ELEERRAHRDGAAGQRVEQQRIERSHQYRRGGGGEEQVVEDQGPFAADRREQAAGPKRTGPQREQGEGAADEQRQQPEDDEPARRIGGEGMYRGEDAGAHEERAEQAQRE